MLKNKEFQLNATDPEIEVAQEKPAEHFAIVCTALVKNTTQPFNVFSRKIIHEMKNLPEECLLWILPEYCFRDTDPEEVFHFIHTELFQEMPTNLTIVLGTIEFTLNGKYTNNAIILHNKNIWFRPKTKILEGEVNNTLEAGENKGIIKLPFFNLGVLVCADLWDNSLVKKLVKQKVDIFAVPAWTATTDAQTALNDWASLVRTESTGKSKIVAVCDHFKAPPNSKYEVAGATQIRSPDGRAYQASTEPVFKSIAFLKFSDVEHAAALWSKKGLAQSFLFKPQEAVSSPSDIKEKELLASTPVSK